MKHSLRVAILENWRLVWKAWEQAKNYFSIHWTWQLGVVPMHGKVEVIFEN